ncbi:MAG: glycosyltransferase family 2 protein [Acidobacteria bacterium]|nr:MAG: glycosyltransferase family 2 protein [Acidobacteriota bacterium]REK01480.1 MAG: glycosyltransferase family 2 protein [Acidobacteriota bacterium]REK14436.1 MAG: glycosyltransferase family 2 protein [Acidobacteriota bacterium]REK45151.1 MAG: glycosyltransferase family 2 protein [Acidobacteriota bacterium]
MEERSNEHVGEPLVSVIMPVYNEAEYIENGIRSLLAQTYPIARMEVIVADGMSSDRTREIVEGIASNTELAIKVVDNPGRIAPTGLNCALRRARGSIIVRIDGHCEVDRYYVSNCVRLLSEAKADGVGGPIETIGEGVVAESIALAMSSVFGVGGSAFRTVDDREMYTDTVAFPGYTREIIERAGAFDEELVRNQDDEYNYRIRKLGGKILLSPSIRSRYYSRSTLYSLWRQYFQYGYWKVRVLQLHPRQMSLRQFIPFVFVLSLVVLSLAAAFTTAGKWLFGATVVSYLALNLAASVYAAGRRVALIPFVALSFLILHLSYGFGSMFGLFAFRGRWRDHDKSAPGVGIETDGERLGERSARNSGSV